MALAARVYEEVARRERHAGNDVDQRARRRTRGARVHRVRVRAARNGARLITLFALPLVLVLGYVWLTAQLTAQTYRLHDDQAREAALTQRDTDLRQQVARLESLPRLEAAAAALQMRVPGKVALVAPPQTAAQAPRTAIAASIADVRTWFGFR